MIYQLFIAPLTHRLQFKVKILRKHSSTFTIYMLARVQQEGNRARDKARRPPSRRKAFLVSQRQDSKRWDLMF